MTKGMKRNTVQTMMVLLFTVTMMLWQLVVPIRATDTCPVIIKIDGVATTDLTVTVTNVSFTPETTFRVDEYNPKNGTYILVISPDIGAGGEVSLNITNALGEQVTTRSFSCSSTGYTINLYHYSGELKEAPTDTWESIAGTATSPTDYEIIGNSIKVKTPLGLAWLDDQTDFYGLSNFEGYTLLLENDMDLSAHLWKAIGRSAFKGVFDGQGHVLSGLLCDAGDDNSGLFYSIVPGGLIRNLGITQSYFRSSTSAGAIAGQSGGSIENCWSDALVFSGSVGHSGLAANTAAGSIQNTCFYGNNNGFVFNATYYRNADGSWNGVSDAAAAAQALELTALTNTNYVHWVLGVNGPVFTTATSFNAGVTITLDQTATTLSAVGLPQLYLYNPATHTSTLLNGTTSPYSANVPVGSYWLCKGDATDDATATGLRLGTVNITIAQPSATLTYYSVNLTAGEGIAAVSRTDGGLNAYSIGSSVRITATVSPHYDWQNWVTSGTTTEVSDSQNTSVVVNGTINVTAVATPTVYTISYDLAGGTTTPIDANPTSYTVNDAVTLVNPTRPQYTFAGWTGTGISTPAMSVSFPVGSGGDRSYTATWASSVSELTTLTVDAGTLTPDFSSLVTSYTMSVPFATQKITVTATAVANTTMRITFNNEVVNRLSDLPLRVGENRFVITVSAEDGITQTVYTVTVNRAANTTIPPTGDAGMLLPGITAVLALCLCMVMLKRKEQQ